MQYLLRAGGLDDRGGALRFHYGSGVLETGALLPEHLRKEKAPVRVLQKKPAPLKKGKARERAAGQQPA